MATPRKPRKNREHVVITPDQYRGRINEATGNAMACINEYANMLKLMATTFKLFQSCKVDIPEEEYTTAMNGITTLAAYANGGRVLATELGTLAQTPPTYHPYKTDRLETWELGIGGLLVTISNDYILQSMQSLQTLQEGLVNYLPDDAQVAAEGDTNV